MTDITTAAQMREAAARICEEWADAERLLSGAKALGPGDHLAAAIRAIPCAEDADVVALKAEVSRLRGALAAEAADAAAARKQFGRPWRIVCRIEAIYGDWRAEVLTDRQAMCAISDALDLAND